MCGLNTHSTPATFTPYTVLNCSSVIVSIGVVGPRPALLTMTWKSPNCAAVCLTALNTSSRFDTSALIAIAFVPSLDNLSAAAFALLH